MFNVKQTRTYVTYFTIEADSKEEAEKIYLELVNNGIAYAVELEQMGVEDESYEIE